jgi:hypothetical protein
VFEPQQDQQSEFNSNIASLVRVDKLIQNCHVAFFNDDPDALFRHLCNLRIEARYKMKHKIKDEKCVKECPRCNCDRLFKKLKKTHSIYMQNHNWNIKQKFLEQLEHFELFLTDFMGDKGMLLRDAADDVGL